MKTFPISLWAAEDRPTVRMENLGVQSLSNAELLSIVIGSGSADSNAVETARMLLHKSDNSLKRLYKNDKNELSNIRGIGERKSAKVLAALELGFRMCNERELEPPTLKSAVRVYNFMLPNVGFIDTEEFWIVLCNQNYRLIKAKRISTGGLSETIVDIRIIIREAVKHNATALYAVHNHPSGSLTPSKADNELTLRIKEACKIMCIKFLDHVIITDGNYYSYHEEGRL